MVGLQWFSTGNDPSGMPIGVLRTQAGVDHHVAALSNQLGHARWAVSTTAPSNGVCAIRMTQTTANVLLSGTVQANGTINAAGVNYKVSLRWDGAELVAVASP